MGRAVGSGSCIVCYHSNAAQQGHTPAACNATAPLRSMQALRFIPEGEELPPESKPARPQ